MAVPVTQEDRNAEAWRLEQVCHFDLAEEVASGERDNSPGVQSHARHRIACQEKLFSDLSALAAHNRQLGELLKAALDDDEAPLTKEWRNKVWSIGLG